MGTPELTRARHLSGGIVGVTSKEAVIQLWDVGKETRVWKARNVPHDELNMPVPMHDTDFCCDPTNPLHSFVCCTADGHLREYDRRVKARPVINATL